jgi:hypothetical protein
VNIFDFRDSDAGRRVMKRRSSVRFRYSSRGKAAQVDHAVSPIHDRQRQWTLRLDRFDFSADRSGPANCGYWRHTMHRRSWI